MKNQRVKGTIGMSKYMYEYTKLPPYLPMPRFLINCSISNTAKLLYIQLLGKAQLSQKNQWLDNQGRVYFIYPVHQMAIDMNKSVTTIKDAMKELVEAQLLEKVPEGRGRPNRLYVLFPDEEVGQKTDVGKSTVVRRKTVSNYGLLIIDDLGVESHSEYRMEGLFNVIDRRVRSGKPMIITTNLTMKEMDETKDLNEARIYDRIRAVCQPVQVKGESQRKVSRGRMMEKFKDVFQKHKGEGD